MAEYYNHDIFLLFLGGIFSLILTVTVIFIKQGTRRESERKRLVEERRIRPEAVGDIEAKLDDSIEFRSPDVLEEITKWGIQPLFIVSFASLFSQMSESILVAFFSLIILTFLHEFYLSDKYAKKTIYQLFLLFVWLIFFVLISHKANKAYPKSSDTERTISSINSSQREL